MKNLQPNNIKELIKKSFLWLMERFNSPGILVIVYYSLINRVFLREQKAVISGLLKYKNESRALQGTRYLLRRNIHRLEKGLIMTPRRDIFALDYLEDTVTCYEQACLVEGMCDVKELQWAHDVLKNYFEVTGSHPIINNAKDRFLHSHAEFQNNSPHKPYQRDLSNPPSVCYDDLLELAKRRKSVRWYLQKPVPRELIDKAIHVAALSPSACNRQPFEFRIFDDPILVKQVASLPGGTVGFYDNFPVIVAVIGKLRAYASDRDRHLIYIDSALASMAFIFALETMGLSSCAINWPDIDHLESKITKLLELENDERVIMLISLGYPDPSGFVPYSQKKDLDLIRQYN